MLLVKGRRARKICRRCAVAHLGRCSAAEVRKRKAEEPRVITVRELRKWGWIA